MKVTCDGHFSHLAKPNGRNVLKWVSNLVFKLHNDPTINESNILVLLGQIWIYAKKKRRFWTIWLGWRNAIKPRDEFVFGSDCGVRFFVCDDYHYNVRVFGHKIKWRAINKLITREGVDFACIQETKMEVMQAKVCLVIWGMIRSSRNLLW